MFKVYFYFATLYGSTLCERLDGVIWMVRQSFGRCPSMSTKTDFNLTAYQGIWYVYASTYTQVDKDQKCISVNYTIRDDGFLNIRKSSNNHVTNNITTYLTGSAWAKDVKEPGKLTVLHTISWFYWTTNHWVLETDYKSFSVVWSCSVNKLRLKSELLWILTRDQFPSLKVTENALKIAESNGIKRKRIKKIEQKNCRQT
ncbi:apolipoprotein D-like [Artemia franciscana]|uniref:apolipoprotein D-like n=1 Tax=Artemia franciscana TaxID=6661 RepID=UPI0032DB5D16